jgi:undecaprenyl pyrophosphate phosphatase UppP
MSQEFFILIIIGTIPISICGLLFKRFIEGEARGLYVVSAALILLAIVLFIAEKAGKEREKTLHSLPLGRDHNRNSAGSRTDTGKL